MTSKKIIYLFVFVSIIFFALVYYFQFSNKKQSIYIAVACPMSDQYADQGQSVYKGVELYIDKVNAAGGIYGRKIEIDVFDDKNDPAITKEIAHEIIEQDRAVAVIGHYDSACSLAGGEIYRDKHLPAITPYSADINVTINNDWYFRTVNNSSLQGYFFANYVKHFIGTEIGVSIIYEDHIYGTGLAKAVAQACSDLGIEIKYVENFPSAGAGESFQDKVIESIVTDGLANVEEPGIIFIASRAEPGVKMVKQIRDGGLRNLLSGPDSFASKTFQNGFHEYPMEKMYPGYYSDGIFVLSHILFDTANEEAQKFRENYETRYRETVSSAAAFAYDSAGVIVEALKKLDIKGKKDNIKKDRQKIREFLAQLSDIDYSVEGVTGFNYFDKNGDPLKEVYFGLYKSNHLISTYNQMRNIHYLNEISDVEKAINQGRVIVVDNNYMYRNQIVKTGVKFNEISDIDINKLTCSLDFNIWFRYQGVIDMHDIVFDNAVEQSLGLPDSPVLEKTGEFDNYKLYNVKGVFKIDAFPERYAFGRHVVGIRLHHRNLTENKLIFATDTVGMGLIAGESAINKMKKANILGRTGEWSISHVKFFNNIFNSETQGRPEYLNLLSGNLKHSAFNVLIKIKKESFTIRGLIPYGYSKAILIVNSIIICLMAFLLRKSKYNGKYIRLIQVIALIILVLSAEVYVVSSLLDSLSRYHLMLLVRLFSMVYWMMLAFILVRALESFVWNPLEKRTGRMIPLFLRSFISFIIYFMATLGIVAFVFNQKITSLLASSGVVAMIIGLAVQMNISNIFSGLALNIERPFLLGDWVSIKDFEEGEVVDIGWRTTRVKTRDNCILSIPNSMASESVIKNYHYPDDIYELWFPVYIDPVYPPEKVEKILLDAAHASDCVLKYPAPTSRLSGGLQDWAAKYYLIVNVKGRAKKNTYNGMVWKNILTALYQAGIKPARRQEIHIFRDKNDDKISDTVKQVSDFSR